LAVDELFPSLPGRFAYPLTYGYATVGRVIDRGTHVSSDWQDAVVFAFQPHTSHFTARPSDVVPLDPGCEPEEAIFLANMESAVNFVMDGHPLLGEQVVVIGQGTVGLLTTALLAQIPLTRLITMDIFETRRDMSRAVGAHYSLDPSVSDLPSTVETYMAHSDYHRGADITFELSGSEQGLDQAIAVTGFSGRIIIGSWYGQKAVSADLGGTFHRSRIRLISSQVSTVDPRLTGRWTKARRLTVAKKLLREVNPRRFITHRIALDDAARAYALLDRNPEEALQVIFTYT
jgi:2-desacetyl-2-hydroxyethyl bacteriochlorophyllide A dehydrogenase